MAEYRVDIFELPGAEFTLRRCLQRANIPCPRTDGARFIVALNEGLEFACASNEQELLAILEAHCQKGCSKGADVQFQRAVEPATAKMLDAFVASLHTAGAPRID